MIFRSNFLAVRAAILWLGLLGLAILNGALRQLVLEPAFLPSTVHLVSTLIGAAVLAIAVRITWNWLAIHSIRKAILVGLCWLVATAIFETFLLNRWISELSWEEIRQTYNITSGQLWPFVLLWIGILPPGNFAWDLVATQQHGKSVDGKSHMTDNKPHGSI